MISRSGYWLMATFCVCMPLRPCDADDIQTIAVPQSNETIELDGRLSEAVWSRAALFPVNETARGAIQPGCGTSVRLWRSADALYLGFRCENPYLPLFLKAENRPRDGSAYSDEDIEIFIRTPAGEEPTRQLIVNALGSVYDGTFSSGPRADWNGAWTCVTSVVRGAWYAEVRIPFSDLGGSPKEILINCARAGYGKDGLTWNAVWKAPGYFKPSIRIPLEG
jgi:hypothetical protein